MQTIPGYRMTDADVETDRKRFRDLDVTFVNGTKVGKEFPIDKLVPGGRLPGRLHRDRDAKPPYAGNSPARTFTGSSQALDFLKHVNHGIPVTVGKEVIVIGVRILFGHPDAILRINRHAARVLHLQRIIRAGLRHAGLADAAEKFAFGRVDLELVALPALRDVDVACRIQRQTVRCVQAVHENFRSGEFRGGGGAVGAASCG